MATNIVSDLSRPTVIYLGDTIDITFTIQEPDGFPTNLTDKRVFFGAKRKIDDDTYIFRKECVIVDPVNGIARAELTEIETNPTLPFILFSPGQVAVTLIGELVIIDGTERRTVVQLTVDLTRKVLIPATEGV